MLKRKILIASIAAALACGGFTVGTLSATAKSSRQKPGITPTQVNNVVRTAVAAQPGLINELEVEYKRGGVACEIDIIDAYGKKHEITVDVATNRVIKRK